MEEDDGHVSLDKQLGVEPQHMGFEVEVGDGTHMIGIGAEDKPYPAAAEEEEGTSLQKHISQEYIYIYIRKKELIRSHYYYYYYCY